MRTKATAVIDAWVGISIAAFLIGLVDRSWVLRWGGLVPERVWHGELWRLVTWQFVELGPISALGRWYVVRHFGARLATSCDARALVRYLVAISLAAAIPATLLAALLGRGDEAHLSGMAISNAILIAWTLRCPGDVFVVVIAPMIRLRGIAMIAVVLATVLFGVAVQGPFGMSLELFGFAAALLYPTSGSSRPSAA